MSPDEETRELASDTLPRVSPELALVDAAMAHGLRRREQIVARRRPIPFSVLSEVPNPDDEERPPPQSGSGSSAAA